MTTYIYTLNCPYTNTPYYIGKTCQSPKRRFSQHISSELNNNNKKANWIKSLKNKGTQPILEIIDQTEENDWEWLERYWISQYKTWGFDIKNLTDGGDGNKGQFQSEETKKKRSKALKGKKRPQDVINKISNSHKGKKLSKVTKEKLRVINLGKKYAISPQTHRRKSILQYDENNMLIKEWCSLTEAAKCLNLSKGTLWQALNSSGRILYKGFKWSYKQDIV